MMIDRFLEYLELERNYSPHTIKNYRIDLQFFQTYLEQNTSIKSIESVTSKDLRLYIVYLTENKFAEKTINRKISSYKSYVKFLKKIGEITPFHSINVKTPKIPKKIQTVFSESEINTLLDNDAIYDESYKSQLNKTMLEIFYSTGIRKSELHNLMLHQIDFHQNTIKVIGKRNKERMIPIAEKLIIQIKKYLALRESIKSENVYLFINKKGRRISEKSIYNCVKNHLTLVTPKQKKSPHMLRHTFATHLLNNGAEISTIKELMGHSSLASTQIYTSLSLNNLKKVFNQAHPRGQKN